jgi:hypothetical protein
MFQKTKFCSIFSKSEAMYVYFDRTNVSDELITSICRANKLIFPVRDYQNYMA